METSKPLLKDAEAEDVDVHLYRSMIGSLMYLTSLRPDIMSVVCACARFQVTPKVSHLHAVKRIVRYLKDSKSTTGGCQFLGSRLISWQCKKKTIVANSTTEAEYVAAASCCGQFWATAKAKTVNGEVQIQALVDEKNVIVTETSVRRALQLKDAEVFLDKQVEGMTKHKEIYVTPSHTKKETEVPQPNSPPHTHVADKAASIGVDVKHGGLVTTVTSLDARQGSGNINKTSSMPHDSPLSRVNTLGSDEGSMTLNELIDPSKQGRKIDEIDQDPDISLVQHDVETQERYGQEMEFETEAYTAEDVRTARPVSTVGLHSYTAFNVTISTASPPRVSTAEDVSTVEILVSIRRSASKGKAIVEADEKIAARLQAEEQAELTIEERLRLFVELMDKRKKYFAAKRAKEKRNKNVLIRSSGKITQMWPGEEFERVLWEDLKTMFDPPSTEDAVWNLAHQQKVLSWRYFHSCVVHCLTLEAAHIYMLTEVKYPLPPRVCKVMLEKKLLGDRKDEVCYQLLKLIEKQAQQK
ncbi:hypothetical protein Tco_1118472 [Tanacetum coccineum]